MSDKVAITAEEPSVRADEPTRDALIVYALLSRLGKKCTKNEVLEAVSASAADDQIGWATDAISGFGFLCNTGNVKFSAINSSILPALALGKNGQLIILEEIQEDRISVYNSQNTEKKYFTEKEFKDWFSGQLIYAEPALEDSKTIKERLKALSPLRTLGTARFLWVAVAALLSNILGLSTSLFIMVVYDRVLPNQAIDSLYGLAIGVGIAILFDTILKGARSRIVARASVRADIAVNEDIFEQFVEVSNTKDRKSVGELSTVMRDLRFSENL